MKVEACALKSTQAESVGKKSIAVASEFSHLHENIGLLHR